MRQEPSLDEVVAWIEALDYWIIELDSFTELYNSEREQKWEALIRLLDHLKHIQKRRETMSAEADYDEINTRFTYHTPTYEQQTKYVKIRDRARDLAWLIAEICPESREKSLAITKLEEAVMWANASVARR